MAPLAEKAIAEALAGNERNCVMRKILACLTLLGGFVFPVAGPVYAQGGRGGGGDWMTSGGDAQRSVGGEV